MPWEAPAVTSEGQLVFVEDHGLANNKLVITSNEFGCIGIKLTPVVCNGYRHFKLPLSYEDFTWDFGEGCSETPNIILGA